MTKGSKLRPLGTGRSNRRTFLAGATALGASAAILGAPRIARAAGDVKVLNAATVRPLAASEAEKPKGNEKGNL